MFQKPVSIRLFGLPEDNEVLVKELKKEFRVIEDTVYQETLKDSDYQRRYLKVSLKLKVKK